jgi:hypothetical protein
MRWLPALGSFVAAALAFAGCGGATATVRLTTEPQRAHAGARVTELYALVDLPRRDETQSLSAVVYDGPGGRLLALQDSQPRIIPLVAKDDFRAFTVGAPIVLHGRPEDEWDGEGLARAPGGFFVVAYERGPILERFDFDGRFVERVPLPPRYAETTRPNLGLESLTTSPSGRYLFTTTEAALRADGPLASKTRGTRVRILRRELATGKETEAAYRTEPLGNGGDKGDMGVSDLEAFSDDDLLVLERGYQPGFGNTVRVFKVDLRGARDVSSVTALGDEDAVLPKRLVADVGAIWLQGCTHPGTQPNPMLENYEGLSLGPIVDDRRRLLFMVSDDNERKTQPPRVLVLSVPLEMLSPLGQ